MEYKISDIESKGIDDLIKISSNKYASFKVNKLENSLVIKTRNFAVLTWLFYGIILFITVLFFLENITIESGFGSLIFIVLFTLLTSWIFKKRNVIAIDLKEKSVILQNTNPIGKILYKTQEIPFKSIVDVYSVPKKIYSGNTNSSLHMNRVYISTLLEIDYLIIDLPADYIDEVFFVSNIKRLIIKDKKG